jgi:hypothetical protein
MDRVKHIVAVLAVGALLALGAVVAFAAPSALANVATPSAGAAQAEYCPPGELARRQAALRNYNRQMAKAKARYFKLVKNKKKRAAFVKKQIAQQKALKRAVTRCG